MDKNEMQAQAEKILADIEAERGMPFNLAWRDTFLALMKMNGATTQIIYRVADTVNMIDREAGVLPKKSLKLD